MMKVLFIWQKRSRGILEGGGQASRKNYDMIRSIVCDDIKWHIICSN